MAVKIKNEITPDIQSFFNLNATQLETIAQMAVENMVEATIDMCRDLPEDETTFSNVKQMISYVNEQALEMLDDHFDYLKEVLMMRIKSIKVELKQVSFDENGFKDADVTIE